MQHIAVEWPMESTPGSRIRCGSCLSFNDEDAKYCSQCGRPLDRQAGTAGSIWKVLFRGVILLCIATAAVAGGIFLHEKFTAGPDGKTPPRTKEDRTSAAGPRHPTEKVEIGVSQNKPAEEGAADQKNAVSPEEIVEKTVRGLHIFTGRSRKGEVVSLCTAMRLPSGLAVPAGAIEGCHSAWVAGCLGSGFEVRMLLLYDQFTGGALIEAPGKGGSLASADPASLEMGERLYLVSPAKEEGDPLVVPGIFCGRTYDSSTGSLRYMAKAQGPGELGAVVVDSRARFLGLVPPEAGKGEEILFIPSGLFEIGSGGSMISLGDIYVLYYSGSFEALAAEARELVAEGRLEEAIERYDQARLRDARQGADLDPELLTTVLKLAARLMEQRKPAAALEHCSLKANEFPLSTELAVVAFRAAVRARDFAAAAGWMQRVAGLDEELYLALEGEHTSLYLEWGKDLLLRDERRSALNVVREGISFRPGSASLHESLGNLLKALRDYAGAAAAYLDAIRLDPSRGDGLSPLVERCAELQATPGSVVLDFDPKKHIDCIGLLAGRVRTDFIVDTGASFTSIPTRAAESLGIRVAGVRDRSYIITANGRKEVPYVRIDSLDVGGLRVKNILVLINDLPDPDTRYGLLGLNFLKHFDYTIDHQSGRMVLKPK